MHASDNGINMACEGGKILVVDDDAGVIELLALSFSEAGYQVDSALNGSFAENKLRKEAYDVIISDVNMPFLDGISLASCVRRSYINRHTPILIVSGQLDRGSLVRLIGLGVKDFILKPFDIAEIMRRVAELVRCEDQSEKVG